jgi:Whi5 like
MFHIVRYRKRLTEQNAEALRLRLKVAMYKVKTNQTDLPLSQLQIRSSRTGHPYSQQPTCTSLPLLRPTPAYKHNKPATPPRGHPLQARDFIKAEALTTIPSSPPRPMSPDGLPSTSYPFDPVQNRSDFTTPVIPRSRDGYSHPHLLYNSRGSPQPCTPEVTLTSSVVKGRAADGLLSLMGRGGGPRHT